MGFLRFFTARSPWSANCKLVRAAKRGKTQHIQVLLQNGADPNAKRWPASASSDTALMCAAYKGHIDVMRILLDAGADPNSKRVADDVTALMRAVDGGRTEAVRILLEAGADPNSARVPDGATALMFAAEGRRAEAARMLLQAHADPNARRHDIVPHGEAEQLLKAARNGAVTPPDTIADSYASNPAGTTALILAAVKGYADMAGVLLEGGANPDLADGNGVTALMRATIKEHIDVLRVLIRAGANVNLSKDNGCSALILATLTARKKAEDVLLRAAAGPRDRKGRLVEYCEKRDRYYGWQGRLHQALELAIDIHTGDVVGLKGTPAERQGDYVINFETFGLIYLTKLDAAVPRDDFAAPPR